MMARFEIEVVYVYSVDSDGMQNGREMEEDWRSQNRQLLDR